MRGAVLGLVIYAVSWAVAPAWKKLLQQESQPELDPRHRHPLFDFCAWSAAGIVFGTLVAIGYLVLWKLDASASDYLGIGALVGVCGLPWIILARVIADVFFVAFAEFIPGADAGLEYQARSSGIFMLAELGWLIWFSLVLGAWPFKNWLAHAAHGWVATSLVAAGGLSGAFSVIVGSSSKTAAIIQRASGLRQYFGLNTLAAIAVAIFATRKMRTARLGRAREIVAAARMRLPG